MTFWEEWGNTIIGLTGLATTIAAFNKDALQNKVTKNQDKRDASNTAVSASEQAVNIMQDVLDSVNQARAADKEREDNCHKALAELRDELLTVKQEVKVYRQRVMDLEAKFNV